MVLALARNEHLFTFGETDDEFVANSLRVLRSSLSKGQDWASAYATFKTDMSTRKRNSRLDQIVANEALTRVWVQISWFGSHFRTTPLMQIKATRAKLGTHAEVNGSIEIYTHVLTICQLFAWLVNYSFRTIVSCTRAIDDMPQLEDVARAIDFELGDGDDDVSEVTKTRQILNNLFDFKDFSPLHHVDVSFKIWSTQGLMKVLDEIFNSYFGTTGDFSHQSENYFNVLTSYRDDVIDAIQTVSEEVSMEEAKPYLKLASAVYYALTPDSARPIVLPLMTASMLTNCDRLLCMVDAAIAEVSIWSHFCILPRMVWVPCTGFLFL